ncbi:MAG: hypothetical protein JSV62_15845 [Promethearchaeota archaeon]|nr:MAG: hypothetical protein JSV62_15845 [Candidatus Lokiarchaeota archaeon]
MNIISKKKFVFFLFIFLSLSTVLFQNYTINNTSTSNIKHKLLKTSQSDTLVIGTKAGPFTIDPHDAYDPYSFNYIEQICEGLYACNYSDPSNKIIPRLALDYPLWAPDKLSCIIPIRQNITFHDGAPLNATAVYWNFERLAYFLNVSGNLPGYLHKAQANPEYFWPDGTPIINRTEVVGLYNIRFILNKPFTALEGLLSFVGSFILSPKSSPPTDYIILPDGIIIGTGPFTCDNFSSNTEILFHAYENYWRSSSNINTIIYSIYSNNIERCQALLDGDIDFLMNPHESFIDAFNNSQEITLIEPETRSWVIFYIAMNNLLIDRTLREVISYSVDYNYITSNILNKLADRLRSPIPSGLIYSNYSLNVPILNFTHARAVMQSLGYGTTFTTDEEWETANFFSLNITYFNNSKYRAIFSLMKNNLSKIGITIEDAGLSNWYDYMMKLFYNKNQLELFILGWGAFYNDPYQFINFLFSNESSYYNSFQYSGGFGDIIPYDTEYDVQLLMKDALNETDPLERRNIYNKIQKLMIERDFPLIWLFTPKVYVAYKNDLIGIEENTFCSVNQNDESSLKADLFALNWEATPSDGEPSISGYNVLFFSMITLLFIFFIIRNTKTRFKDK